MIMGILLILADIMLFIVMLELAGIYDRIGGKENGKNA